MIDTVTQEEFIDAFQGYNGWSDTYKNNFSYDGLVALYDFLEDYEDSTDSQIPFDRVALAVEYSEYANLAECIEDYSDIINFEDLQNLTTVIYIDQPPTLSKVSKYPLILRRSQELNNTRFIIQQY